MTSLSLQRLTAEVLKNVNNISGFYAQHVLPYLAKQRKASYIASAAVLFICYQVYQFAHIPKKLKHIPAVPFWAYMRSVLSGEGPDKRLNLIYSVLSDSPSGVFLKPHRVGWTVGAVGPQALKTVWIRKDDYPKSQSLIEDKRFLFAKMLGVHNILGLNGAEWKKHRMIANPAFHRHMPVKLFGKLCERMMSRFEIEEIGLSSVDISALMQRFTLDVIGLAGFGYDFQSIENPDNQKVMAYNSVMDGLKDPFFFFFPFFEKHMLWAFSSRREQHLNCESLHTTYQNIIENKKRVLLEQKGRQEDPEKDLLTLMLEAGEDDPSQALTDEELRENLSVFFIAGHDTTSNALSFALYWLAVNPDIQEKARSEVIKVIGDGADVFYPTENQISQLKYIYMIMKETDTSFLQTLRLCPPVLSSQLRHTEEDIELAGTVIPKGVHIQAEIFVAHHDPSVWKDPEQFRPERFAAGGENEENARKGLAWSPFGNGARQCIGMNFSLAEQRVVLSMLLRKYTWTLPKDSIHKGHPVFVGGSSLLLSAQDLHLSFKNRF
ncbi:hypothetical protein INT43_006295 [Umbelopsis isabellina]|uniref:Cytochrome P450 n=1 Tax=Mortierella isabellina TaxID=91625 RepID=A0A8H7UHI6_MORIS|nr:hypothetical protein INT43_006295 [Umbelopsis isabellina]